MSADGGGGATWGPQGKELFYVEGTRMMRVAVTVSGGTFSASRPEALWSNPSLLYEERTGHNYDHLARRDPVRYCPPGK